MNIVLLDGHSINPGDLSWKPLEGLCDHFTVYERTAPEDIADRIKDCEILMTSKCFITRDLMKGAPKLKYIGSTATGYNNINIEAARDLGIAVTNIPAYSTEAVAQHAIALMLELTNQVGLHSESVHAGEWTDCEYFCYWKKPVTLLAGRSLGIIGYGAIGRRVGKIAEALGMSVNVHSHDRQATVTSDFVTLHCPLTAENAGMINRAFIKEMKPGAFLINTARGGLVNEADLAQALNDGTLAGAAVDVLSSEPPAADNPLLHADNCIITPHIAWAPREMRRRVIDVLAGNLMDWRNGGTLNRVEIGPAD
ncbi:MAG: D-2-hydroxyacid dehydrogenase [Bacillota bacterium]|nr:D-2-hydroxyacid dehydrogenase [Bacillota bacterium]